MVYEVNEEDAGAIDVEWRKAMEQLMQEEQQQMQEGSYGKDLHTSYCLDCLYLRIRLSSLCILCLSFSVSDYGFQPIQGESNPNVV